MKDAIDHLHACIEAARDKDPSLSRTAKLLRGGSKKIAKKLVEEAVEVGFDAIRGDPDAVILESADLLYNLCVLWVDAGVSPGEVMAEIDRRERLFGIAEKLPKPGRQPQIPHVGAARRVASAR